MFSNACKYGIRAVLYLAAFASETKKIGVQQVAEALEVPRYFLAKILLQLSKDQLVVSTKGPRGGYYISDAVKEMSLLRIVESIDGLGAFEECVLGLPICSSENPCPLHLQVFALREGLHLQVKHQTIGEFADRLIKNDLKI